MFDSTFWYAVVITFLGELLLHWVPWPRQLPRVVAYTLGMTVILIGCGLWLITTGYSRQFAGIVGICVVAGLATLLGYGIDSVQALIVHRQVQHDRDGS